MREKLSDFWANLPLFLRVSVLLAVTAAILFFAIPPALGLWQTVRGDTHLQKAAARLDSKQYSEARSEAISALQAGSKSNEVYPLLLQSMIELDDPQATDVAVQVLLNHESSEDDHLSAWRFLCRKSPIWPVAYLWETSLSQHSFDSRYVVPLCERFISEDMLDQASQALTKLNESDDKLTYLQLKVLVKRRTHEAYQEFALQLSEVLKNHTASEVTLLPLIDEIDPQLFPARGASAVLYHFPKTKPFSVQTELRRASLKMISSPSDADQIFEEVIAKANPADWGLLTEWCLQMDRKAQAAELAQVGPLSNDLSLREIQLAAVIAGGTTNEQIRLLEQGSNLQIPTWEKSFLELLKTRARNDRVVTEKDLRKTLDAAATSFDHGALLKLSKRAKSAGFDKLAREALLQAFTKGQGPLPLSSSLAAVVIDLAASGREDELLDLLIAARRIEPGNAILDAQFTYLACLRGIVDPEDLIKTLEPLVKAFADELSLRSALALGYLLTDQPNRALEITAEPNIDWFETSASIRGIRALSLTAAGEDAEAEVYLNGFSWDKLLPSEQRVFRAILQESQGP